MTRNELKGFEEMAERVMRNTDKQQGFVGLGKLCDKMRGYEPLLYETAERCGELSITYQGYVGYRNRFEPLRKNCLTMFNVLNGMSPIEETKFGDWLGYMLRGKEYFDTYDSDTPEQAKEREQKRKDLREHDHRNGFYGDPVQQDAGVKVMMQQDQWQYMLRGYYCRWVTLRETFDFRLCRGLMKAGYGSWDANIIDELKRDYMVEDWGKLSDEWREKILQHNSAEESLMKSAEVLKVCFAGVYLWKALCNERDALQEELGLYGTLPSEGAEQHKQFQIDQRLTTDKARAMFQKFADEGYIKMNEGAFWEWLKPHSFLGFAYFVEKASVYLGLTTTDYTGKERHCRKPFEVLFNSRSTSGQKPPNRTVMDKIDKTFKGI